MTLPTFPTAIGILARLVMVLVALGGTFVVGARYEANRITRENLAEQQQLNQELVQRQKVINRWAEDFSRLRQEGDDRAAQLRRRLKNVQTPLATCDSDGVPRLAPDFVGLFNDALQATSPGRREPPGAAGRTRPSRP